MDKTLKRKWLKALRGGRYKQGEGELKAFDRTYCCLGVLANIQGAKWKSGVPKIGGVQASPRGEYDILLLRPDFAGGITQVRQFRLAEMNDGSGRYTSRHTFEDIADYIEREL
jgi:hypothetical protein